MSVKAKKASARFIVDTDERNWIAPDHVCNPVPSAIRGREPTQDAGLIRLSADDIKMTLREIKP